MRKDFFTLWREVKIFFFNKTSVFVFEFGRSIVTIRWSSERKLSRVYVARLGEYHCRPRVSRLLYKLKCIVKLLITREKREGKLSEGWRLAPYIHKGFLCALCDLRALSLDSLDPIDSLYTEHC